MELMREFPDKHFELAIVDPPYGIGEDASRALTRKGSSAAWKTQKLKVYAGARGWDKNPPDASYFKELIRISKNQIVWGANHFISRIAFDSPAWIVWAKNGQNPNSDFADCELAYTSFRRAVRMFTFDWTGFGAVNAKEDRIHPTQKPVALYRWILHNYAKPGDKILDTHLGSGSIAIACHEKGFHLTGSELDPDYFAAMQKRLAEATAQGDMFGA